MADRTEARRHSLILLTVLVAFGPVSTDLYLASLPDIAHAFSASVATTQLTLSAFLVGFALAMPLYGPLSDRFGRRPVLLGGTTLYLAASLFCVAAPTITALIAGRFAQALGACCGPVVARAVVRDVYPREQGARVMSLMASAMALAPLFAPMLGGWLDAQFGWRADFIALVLFGAGLLVALWLGQAETNRQPDHTALAPAAMLGNYGRLLTSPRVMSYVLAVTLVFSAMFSFISASSFILIGVLGLAPDRFGFGFGVVILGYTTGAQAAARLTHRFGLDRMIAWGLGGAVLAGAVLGALVWSSHASLVTILGPMAAFFFFTALVLPNATAGAIMPFPRMAGTASALVGFIQMVTGAVAAWTVALFYDGTARSLATQVPLLAVAGWIAFRRLSRVER